MNVNKWAALFGILAAVLLVAGVFTSGDTPDGDAPEQEWISYIEGDESAVLLRAYIFVAASLSLVAVFAFGIRPRLGSTGPVDQSLAILAAGATVLGAGAVTVGGLIGAAVGAAHMFGDVPIDGGTASLFDNLMYGCLIVGAAVPTGVLMAVVAIQVRRRGLFPQWVLWLSIVGVVGMAASVIFIPFILLPVWLIAISIAILRDKATPMAGSMA